MNKLIEKATNNKMDKSFIEWLTTLSEDSVLSYLSIYYERMKPIVDKFVVDELVTKLEGKIDGVLANTQNELKVTLATLTEKTSAIPDKIRLMNAEKEEQITSKLSEHISKSQLDIYNKIAESDKKKLVPSVKGKIGEDIVKKMISPYNVRDTSQLAHSGDFIIEDDGKRLMIDAKNYDRTVPKLEIDKFCKDIASTGVDCAMMISLYSSITGKENFELEVYQDTKPIYCIFLAMPDNEVLVRQSIKILFALAKRDKKVKHSLLERLVGSVRDKLATLRDASRELELTVNAVNKCRSIMSTFTYMVERDLDSMLDKVICDEPVVEEQEREKVLMMIDALPTRKYGGKNSGKSNVKGLARQFIIGLPTHLATSVDTSSKKPVIYIGPGKLVSIQILATKMKFTAKKDDVSSSIIVTAENMHKCYDHIDRQPEALVVLPTILPTTLLSESLDAKVASAMTS